MKRASQERTAARGAEARVDQAPGDGEIEERTVGQELASGRPEHTPFTLLATVATIVASAVTIVLALIVIVVLLA